MHPDIYAKIPPATDILHFESDQPIIELFERMDYDCTYIERNLQHDFNLNTLCEELYITKSYLHQLFLKHLHISPKKYIITKQLTLAQREIRSGAKPTDVYSECGFANYSTFYRDYKKYFGHAPSEETERKIIREIEF